MSRRRLGPIPAQAAVPRSPLRVWEACCRGEEPAEVLDRRDREDLLAGLEQAGWSVELIATHTRTSEYTVRRILDGARRQQELAAARAWTAQTRREPPALRCRPERRPAARTELRLVHGAAA